MPQPEERGESSEGKVHLLQSRHSVASIETTRRLTAYQNVLYLSDTSSWNTASCPKRSMQHACTEVGSNLWQQDAGRGLGCSSGCAAASW